MERLRFYSLVKKRLDEKGKTFKWLAEQLGKDRAELSNKLRGRRILRVEEVIKICELLDIPKGEGLLLSGALPSEAYEIFDIFLPVPLLPGEIPCGTPKEVLEDYMIGYTYLPRDILREALGNAYESGLRLFAVRVTGNSMSGDSITDGARVVWSPDIEVQSGDIAVVNLGGALTVKRVFFYSDRVVLQSSNPSYPPIVADLESVSILGKVIMHFTYHNHLSFYRKRE